MPVAVLSHCIVFGGTGLILGVGLTVTVTVTDGPSLHPTGLIGVIVYVTVCGASVGLTRTSDITYPFANPAAPGVNPVTPPVAVAVNLNVTTPLVKVLGLWSVIPVAVLSHCIVFGGTGKTLGVGLTVTMTFTEGPSAHPVGLTGVMV
jgi:hypothetical protein